YLGLHPEGFRAAARETDIAFGTVNTAILMTSSFSLAVAGRAADARLYRPARLLLLATLSLGALFLVVKAFEYRADIDKHLLPGPGFALAQPGAALFFSFYW